MLAVLGPIELLDGQRRVGGLGGVLPRRLLTVLVAAEGRPVPDSWLVEAVWAGRPPGKPEIALQVYVSRLRRAMGDRGPGTLRRTKSGYELAIQPGGTDVDRFRELTEEARLAAAAGRVAQARSLFEAALRLWRGEPYSDVPDDDTLTAKRAALQQLHDAAQEDSVECLIGMGENARAVAELEALVRSAPFRERRWVQLAEALYRCDRQTDALAAIRRVRALLAEELGVEPGPQLREVEGRILRHDAGLLLRDPGAAGPARLPRPLSSFVGREAELALLDTLVSAQRMVTVVGPAGAGKTRLTLEWAARHGGDSWFVRLADVSDPARLAGSIGRAVGVADQPGDATTAVLRRLNGVRGLLILDNGEHLTAPLARIVNVLLAGAPGLRVLATSRRPLTASGEHVLPLAPLATGSAVDLLRDRIRAVRPTWAEDARDHASLRRIAVALDGIPLALELAAARTRVLNLHDVAERLDDRFALLGTVPDRLLNPHETLFGAIGWSFGLLADAERELLVRLWPYEGGFALAAAGPAGLDMLDSLVGQSLVEVDVDARPTRFRVLETVRAYCRAVDPTPRASRELHSATVRAMVADAAQALLGAGAPRATRELNRELANIRVSVAHDLATTPVDALRTATGLLWFWIRAGLLDEGRRTLAAAMRAAGDAAPPDVAQARAASAVLAYVGGDGDDARRLLAEAIRDWEATEGGDDTIQLAEMLYYQALVQNPNGDARLAWSAATRAYRIAARTGTAWLRASAEMAQGSALLLAGRAGEARHRLRAAAEHGIACGQTWTAALSYLMAAQSLLAERRTPDEVLPILGRALRLFRHEEDLSGILSVVHSGAMALAAAGDPRAAGLHATVHQHRERYGIRPGPTAVGPVPSPGWSPPERRAEAPTLDDSADLLQEIADSYDVGEAVDLRQVTPGGIEDHLICAEV
ncbi:BTAD domain-containing putative transcriptional regulator [Paractinoplanes brasiliensis]|uniref:Putative ATPase n=1 Tax=Paractinoplanes brasiliensis TaxID=52695 RepID=A0A4V3C8J2_9ACTN|nr:BTAD domain-containing putative transcriptional regulator [Actinoplanes brasiliensis]TDO41808.1 putative ATPase [Actinoplanes brasiliensis]